MKSVLLLGLLISSPTFAQDNQPKLDEASAKALSQTTQMIQDPKQREAELVHNPQAKAVDEQIKSFTNGDAAKQEQIYKIASDAFEKIVAEANGDPEKIQALLIEAQKNPEAFGQKNLTDEQKKLLRDLASEQKK